MNARTKVYITCSLHGGFLQSLHKQGKGCPECADKTLTTKESIADFRKVHGDRYDYSKVDYVNSKTKVSIICPVHGEQRPSGHKRGLGCPSCAGNKTMTLQKVKTFVKSMVITMIILRLIM